MVELWLGWGFDNSLTSYVYSSLPHSRAFYLLLHIVCFNISSSSAFCFLGDDKVQVPGPYHLPDYAFLVRYFSESLNFLSKEFLFADNCGS